MQTTFQEIVEALKTTREGTTYYYDQKRGKLYLRPDADMFGFDLHWLEKELEKDPDRYLRLPDNEEINLYGMMASFPEVLPEDGASFRRDVELAVQGKTAYQRFKYLVYGSKYEDLWRAHKDSCYKAIAENWCRANGLETLCEVNAEQVV